MSDWIVAISSSISEDTSTKKVSGTQDDAVDFLVKLIREEKREKSDSDGYVEDTVRCSKDRVFGRIDFKNYHISYAAGISDDVSLLDLPSFINQLIGEGKMVL